jgi:hypothetical protein
LSLDHIVMNTCARMYTYTNIRARTYTHSLSHTLTLAALNSTIPYMRRVMHEIGEKYGFIDLGIVFSISLDFTLTSAYNERVHRRTQRVRSIA